MGWLCPFHPPFLSSLYFSILLVLQRNVSESTSVIINKPGTFLGKKSRRLVIKHDGLQKEYSLLKLKEITLVGSGISLSNDLIEEALKQGLQINFLDGIGRVYAKIVSPLISQTIETARAQLQSEKSDKAGKLAKAIIDAKIGNQLALLKYFSKYQLQKADKNFLQLTMEVAKIQSISEDLRKYKPRMENYQSLLFSFEGRASDAYWRAFSFLLNPNVKFTGRVGRGAGDLVNSLLNYGYGILYSRVFGEVLKAGLLPFAGFLHTDRSGKASLVLDIMEIFRAEVVDSTVIVFLSKKKKKIEPTSEVFFEFANQVIKRLASKAVFADGKNYQLGKIVEMQTAIIASFLRREGELVVFRK